jgi:hypothetical protein
MQQELICVFLIEIDRMYRVILLNGVWCYRAQKYDWTSIQYLYIIISIQYLYIIIM